MFKRSALAYTLTYSLSVAAMAVLPLLPATAAGYTPFDEGMRQFHARRYSMALGPLERAVSKAPHNAMCRYYLAGCYVHLNRHEDAQREYDMSYRLDPFGPVSGYCRRALLGYGVSVPADTELATLRRRPTLQAVKGPAASVQHNSPHFLNQAVDTIRRQADFEKGRHKQSSDTFASNALRTGEGTARKILDDADAECKAIIDAPLYGIGESRMSPHMAALAREQEMQRRGLFVAEIRKKAENDALRIRTEAQDRSQKFKQFSQDRQAALDEVADSLESQLSTSRLKDRVKMRAEGTGLYVRNFGVLPSPSPEVHNSVARIRPRENPQLPDAQPSESTSEQAGEPGKLPVGESAGDNGKLPIGETAPSVSGPQQSVRGKVLEKI
jgi:ribosome-associated translation inhibitor RaiA